MFKFISENKISQLVESSVEKTFERNFQITREGESANNFYLILRGSGTAYTKANSHYRETFGVGSIIFPANLVSNTG